MNSRWGRRARQGHAALEETMGVLLPLLAIMSVVPELVSLRAVALIGLWIGGGHTLLYFYDLYPQLRYRPFVKGLFAFGAGVCWPLWFLTGPAVRR